MHNNWKTESEVYQMIDYVVSNLIRKDCHPDSTSELHNMVKKISMYPRIRDFFISALYDKAKDISKIINNGDSEKYNYFRNFVRVVINVEGVSNYFETRFLNHRDVEQFLVILEESRIQNKNTTELENSFIQLIGLEKFSPSTVNHFLKILEKDKKWLTLKLLGYNHYNVIINSIDNEAIYDINSSDLKDIIDTIVGYEYPQNNFKYYLEYLSTVLTHTNKYTKQLLSHNQLNNVILENYLLKPQGVRVLISYCSYLLLDSEESFLSFEKKILSSIKDGITLVIYARSFDRASKRAILSRLLQLDDENSVVMFIKQFPQYQHLLPLL